MELALAQSEAGPPKGALASFGQKCSQPVDRNLAAQFYGVLASAQLSLNNMAAAVEPRRLALQADDASPHVWRC